MAGRLVGGYESYQVGTRWVPGGYSRTRRATRPKESFCRGGRVLSPRQLSRILTNRRNCIGKRHVVTSLCQNPRQLVDARSFGGPFGGAALRRRARRCSRCCCHLAWGFPSDCARRIRLSRGGKSGQLPCVTAWEIAGSSSGVSASPCQRACTLSE